MNNRPTPAQVREKFAHEIPRMLKSVMDLGDWIDSVEARLVREKELKILKNGKYKWLKKSKGKTP